MATKSKTNSKLPKFNLFPEINQIDDDNSELEYNLVITFPDGSNMELEVQMPVESWAENFINNSKTCIGITDNAGTARELELFEDGELNEMGNRPVISLSKEASSILTSKLKAMFSDYLAYIKDPNNNKMKEKY